MSYVRQGQARMLIAMASVLLLFGCSRDSNEIHETSSADSGLDAALATVSRENIQSSLNYLAADEREGRMTGSRGYDEAAQFVADQFAAMGLEPGGTDAWFQQVPFITRETDIENSGVTLHLSNGDVDLEWGKDVVIYADRFREETRVRAEVVFAGFAVHAPELDYSDFEGIDIRGKIVAYFSGAPATFPSTERAHFSHGRTKAEELVRRGAIGEIGLMNRLQQSRSTWSGNAGAPRGMAWIDESGEVSDYHPELLGDANFSPQSAEKLFADSPVTFEAALDASEEGRPLSRALRIEVTMYRRTIHERISSPNVVGILRGSDPVLRDEYVVYSTHLDHLGISTPVEGDSIYNGLYDNALGVSMTIETARALASLPERPRRSIVFVAVTAEEHDLLGSDYYAHFPTVPAASIIASVNIDMPMVIFPLNTVTGYGAEHSSLQCVMTEEAIKEGFEYTPDPYPDEVYFIRSDQYSFVRQGIPSLYLAEGVGSSDPTIDGRAVLDAFFADHWHKPDDDLTQPIEWDTALRFARASVRIGYRIATDDQRPTWNEGDFFGDKFGH